MKRITTRKVVVTGLVAALALTAAGVAWSHGWQRGHHGYAMKARAMALFEEVDRNGDDTASRAEIDSLIQDRLESFDGDGNRRLSLAEFEGLWLQQMRPMMVDHFQFLDEDGDGQITQAEIDRPLDFLLARLDRDGDGGVSRQELRKLRHLKGGHRQHHDERPADSTD